MERGKGEPKRWGWSAWQQGGWGPVRTAVGNLAAPCWVKGRGCGGLSRGGWAGLQVLALGRNVTPERGRGWLGMWATCGVLTWARCLALSSSRRLALSSSRPLVALSLRRLVVAFHGGKGVGQRGGRWGRDVGWWCQPTW